MTYANRSDAAAVLQALTRILEHADALLAEGYSPNVALLAALAEHRPSLALSRVARAAWVLAVGPIDGTSTTALEDLHMKGGE